jgi:hypothetical protein
MATTITPVAASTTPVTLVLGSALGIHVHRAALSVYYDGAAILYLLAGEGTPSSTNFTVKMGDGFLTFWEPSKPGFDGALQGIWSAAVGSALVTEYV